MIRVEEGGAELAEERLAEAREVRPEIRRRKHQQMLDGRRGHLHAVRLLTLIVHAQPRARDERAGAVARDVDAFAVEELAIILVQLVGEIFEGRFVVKAVVVEEKDVVARVSAAANKEIAQGGEAGRAVRVTVNDEKFCSHRSVRGF